MSTARDYYACSLGIASQVYEEDTLKRRVDSVYRFLTLSERRVEALMVTESISTCIRSEGLQFDYDRQIKLYTLKSCVS